MSDRGYQINYKSYFLICLVTILIFSGNCRADNDLPAYRFPDLYNPNPLAGRIYLQPIGVYEDRAMRGTVTDIALGASSEYNRHFVEEKGDKEITVNSYIYSLRLSRGFRINSNDFEAGGIIRVHQDERRTPLSSFLRNFHDWVDGIGWSGHSPPRGQYYGAVGDNETPVIGENGEIYLTTVQVYTKMQIMKDGGMETSTPNLSVKLSARIPFSGKEFDRPGAAVSCGISKQVYPEIQLTGAADLIYQDIYANDFDASNLDVERWAYDVFAGLTWDAGSQGNWYFPLGLRWSSKRIAYSLNPDSADDVFVLHMGVNCRTKLKSGRDIEFFMNFNENIPQFGHGLEPDFRVQTGVSITCD